GGGVGADEHGYDDAAADCHLAAVQADLLRSGRRVEPRRRLADPKFFQRLERVPRWAGVIGGGVVVLGVHRPVRGEERVEGVDARHLARDLAELDALAFDLAGHEIEDRPFRRLGKLFAELAAEALLTEPAAAENEP